MWLYLRTRALLFLEDVWLIMLFWVMSVCTLFEIRSLEGWVGLDMSKAYD